MEIPPLGFWVSKLCAEYYYQQRDGGPYSFSLLLILLPSGTVGSRSWILNLLVIVNWDPFLSREEETFSSLTVISTRKQGNFIMENARRVVAKITEFPWGQFCLCLWKQQNVIRNIPSKLSRWDKKSLFSFLFFRKQLFTIFRWVELLETIFETSCCRTTL